MSSTAEAIERERYRADSVLIGRPSDAALTRRLLEPIQPGGPKYNQLLAITGLGALMLVTLLAYTLITGIGVWGNNIPVAWGFAIINFVWWIGIGHAGTFISAVLLLLEKSWRTSINRIAETMTLFAIMMAGIYPVIHLGRAWFFYWLIPYPATTQAWPQFKSALTWDVAAVSTYFTVSLLFWYLGLVPDLAAQRDMASSRRRKRIYGFFALGWRGSIRHWRNYRIAYGLLAGLATPLVLSVHSVVSFDFSIMKQPGFHSTVFPPYFVAGAIFSGFAMVLTLLIPIRRFLQLHHVITRKHLDAMAKLLLVTGSMVGYAYLIEAFIANYTGDEYEIFMFLEARTEGVYAWLYWLSVACNALLPQLFWFRRIRQNVIFLWVASILVNVGMWAERFIIVVTSLSQDFLPSSWGLYIPSLIDGLIFLGTISFFLFGILLFLRFLPPVPVSEVKELNHELKHEEALEA